MGLRNIPVDQLCILNYDKRDMTWGEGIRNIQEKLRPDGEVSATSPVFFPQENGFKAVEEGEEFIARVRRDNPRKKYFVVDTLYFLLQDFFSTTTEKGWDAYDRSGDAVQAITTKWAEIIGEGRFLILHNHYDIKEHEGSEHHIFSVPKGAIVRNQVRPEGRMDMVIEAESDGDEFYYRVKTRGMGRDAIRVLHGLFEAEEETVPNDMKFLLDHYENMLYGKIFDPPKATKKTVAKTSPEKKQAPGKPVVKGFSKADENLAMKNPGPEKGEA